MNDFENITFEIEGELGKHKSLPIESLVKIAESLQNLIFSIAKNDIPSDSPIDLNNFKLEITSFVGGSAIPTFAFTKRVEPTLMDFNKQREAVSSKFEELMILADKGEYQSLKTLYPEPIRRNDIVKSLYSFANSFGNSPVIVYGGGNREKSYGIVKFKKETKDSLIAKIEEIKEEPSKEEVYAKVLVTKTKTGRESKNIQEMYSKEKHSITYTTSKIAVEGRTYILNYPLRCLLEGDKEGCLIEYEALNLVGAGDTSEEAEQEFLTEFDYTYRKLNGLSDDKLSARLIRIKRMINDCVKEVL